MKILKLKCKLLSAIILSEQAATEGTQRTLDYIPGNVFLGIVAGQIYLGISDLKDATPEDRALAFDLFHNSKVRFGDAHPMIEDGKDKERTIRAIRVPASWQVKKGEKLINHVYVYHQIPNRVLHDDKGNPIQPKQCRDEFIFKTDETHFNQVRPKKNFAIKSAYDKELRRSKDQQIYGYQSLEAGMMFCFEVEFEDSVSNNLVEIVKESLVGKRTIGRSKTAQYGQVQIFSDAEYELGFKENQVIEPNHTFLYAESRLLFLDKNGQPSIPIDGKPYKLNGAKVILEKSQIRTFRYAPYNSKRQTRDSDRFGIEKGSVICLDKAIEDVDAEKIKQGIGLFKNEGFGKVLINPEFLKHKNNQGEAIFSYKELNTEIKSTDSSELEKAKEQVNSDPVYLYLKKAKEAESKQQNIFEEVEKFVTANKNIFLENGEQFSSQWGTIRTKAIQAKDKDALEIALFSEEKDNEGFLLRGQSAKKWSEKGRLRKLKSFVIALDESIALKTMVNLSSEMAKICQKKGGIQ